MQNDTPTNLYNDIFEPDSFLRSTGETVARLDGEWHRKKAAGEDVSHIMHEFLQAGLAHLDAMALNRLTLPMLAAEISMLLSLDISGVDIKTLGDGFLELHRRFLTGCIALSQDTKEDAFAHEHAQAILSSEAWLFVEAVSTIAANKGILAQTCQALANAAKGYLQQNPPQAKERAQNLVDIFSRFHALQQN